MAELLNPSLKVVLRKFYTSLVGLKILPLENKNVQKIKKRSKTRFINNKKRKKRFLHLWFLSISPLGQHVQRSSTRFGDGSVLVVRRTAQNSPPRKKRE